MYLYMRRFAQFGSICTNVLNTFTQMMFYLIVIQDNSHVQSVNHQIDVEDSLYEFDEAFYKEDRQDLPIVSYTELE